MSTLSTPRRLKTIIRDNRQLLKQFHRQQTYRVPGHRHISVSIAAALLQPTTKCHDLFDVLCRDSEMRDRIYGRFCEEVRRTVPRASYRAAATKIAHRCFMSGARGVTHFEEVVKDMAAADHHRAFCRCAASR